MPGISVKQWIRRCGRLPVSSTGIFKYQIQEYIQYVTESFKEGQIKEMPCTGALHFFIMNSIDSMIVNGLT